MTRHHRVRGGILVAFAALLAEPRPAVAAAATRQNRPGHCSRGLAAAQDAHDAATNTSPIERTLSPQ